MLVLAVLIDFLFCLFFFCTVCGFRSVHFCSYPFTCFPLVLMVRKNTQNSDLKHFCFRFSFFSDSHKARNVRANVDFRALCRFIFLFGGFNSSLSVLLLLLWISWVKYFPEWKRHAHHYRFHSHSLFLAVFRRCQDCCCCCFERRKRNERQNKTDNCVWSVVCWLATATVKSKLNKYTEQQAAVVVVAVRTGELTIIET